MLLLTLACCAVTVLGVPLEGGRPTTSKCGYQSCTEAEPGVLNVHIVAHTHDDVGWLKTVDQYYYGSRNNIQKAGVQYILDSVVKELWEDPKRRFIYVETAFFWKWWTRQPDAVKTKVHTLVEEGRLQFVGGAWSMNDEAATHYLSTIDQFTWGLRKLNETFGACGIPRVGWQIDPFGHSREFASLLAAMGYDGLFLGRIDYQDKRQRLDNKHMEMLWRGDDDLGKSSDIFTGVLYNTYSPPPGFCFDVLCNDEPIIDDIASPDYNVDVKVNAFMSHVKLQSYNYITNNVLITMGGDFTYQDATMWYTNLDKLIKYGNLAAGKYNLKMKLFYSTPDCYLKAVKDANPTLPTKQDDFFPYASDPHAYWTGYFTSRPTTKYFERQTNAYLQMVKQLYVLGLKEAASKTPLTYQLELNELKSAMGVMQHHDAVTGTEKQHVTRDYERLLDRALEDGLNVARAAINHITGGSQLSPLDLELRRCPLNESSCAISEQQDTFIITVYNPLPVSYETSFAVPVGDGNYTLYGPDGKIIPSEIQEIFKPFTKIPTRQTNATREIIFHRQLPAVGYTSIYVQKDIAHEKAKRSVDLKNDKTNDVYTDLETYWMNVKNKYNNDIKKVEAEIVTEYIRIPDQPVFAKHINDEKEMPIELEKILKDVTDDMDRTFFKRKNLNLNAETPKEMRYPNLNDEEMRMLSDDPAVVERHDFSERVAVEIDPTTNRLVFSHQDKTHINADGDNIFHNFSISLERYPACSGRNQVAEDRASGAYIFRPNALQPDQKNCTWNHRESENYIISTCEFEDDSSGIVVKLHKIDKACIIDWIVGPIPIEDGIGKEYVLRVYTDVVNNGEFYTDSNGRQILKRKLNERPQYDVVIAEPVGGNYYPVVNRIAINDSNTHFIAFTDRSQGGSSLNEGTIELMLHRRLLYDDAFGVGEALNETANNKGLVARGTVTLLFGDEKDVKDYNAKALENDLPPRVLFSASNVDLNTWLLYNNEYSFLKSSLPSGVNLLTLEPWGDLVTDKRILLRLENAANEVNAVDISKLFDFKIVSYRETTLAANQWLNEMEQWSWKTENEFSSSFNEEYGSFYNVSKAEPKADYEDKGYEIKLKQMQIRTFIIEIDWL